MNVTADPVRDIRESASREAKEAAERARIDEPLVDLMGTEAGREYAWNQMEPMRVPNGRTDGGGRWDPNATAFATGVQAVAISLWERLWEACPELVAAMVTEAMHRKRTAK